MKKPLLIFGLVIFSGACDSTDRQSAVLAEFPIIAEQAQNSVPADNAALEENAKAAIQALAETLKGELEAAMKVGGPVNALVVCNIKAPEIASEVSAGHDLQISRTSLKHRNPGNAPNEWQTRVLEDFEARKSAGEDPATLVYSEVQDYEFRFMKAIPTGAVCLVCHGTEISPAVTEKLAKLYPQDKAVGFREGDLRGAFVVIKKLTQ